MTIHRGDCLAVLERMPAESIAAVITDPPYGLSRQPDMAEVLRHWLAGDDYQHRGGGFMGHAWDSFVPGPAVWRECLRVLKPGGHAVIASSSRTFDLLTVSVRLAGFQIRDTITHHYAQGWPKSRDVSAALRALPACRCDVADEGGAVDAVAPAGGVGAGPRAEAGAMRPAGLAAYAAGGERADVGPDAADALGRVDADDDQGSGHDGPVVLGASPVAGAAERDEVGGVVGGVEVEPEALRDEVVSEQPVGGAAVGADPVALDDVGSDPSPAAPLVPEATAAPRGVPVPAEALAVGDGHAGAGAVDAARDVRREGGVTARADEGQQGHARKCPSCGGRIGDAPAGVGTALKPATEFWVLARKPLRSTVDEQVLATGTGGLNVDAARISTDTNPSVQRRQGSASHLNRSGPSGWQDRTAPERYAEERPGELLGRWPANLALSHADECDVDGCREGCPVAALDEQSGDRPGMSVGLLRRGATTGRSIGYGGASPQEAEVGYGDSGAASRFYFVAKPSPAEREYGLSNLAATGTTKRYGTMQEPRLARAAPRENWTPGEVRNVHPTVKPVDLMRWLVRLVAPAGALVLDPYAGSGTTGIACHLEGAAFVGVEQHEPFAAIAEQRLAAWARWPAGTSTAAILAADAQSRRTAAEHEQRRADARAAGQLDLLAGTGG